MLPSTARNRWWETLASAEREFLLFVYHRSQGDDGCPVATVRDHGLLLGFNPQVLMREMSIRYREAGFADVLFLFPSAEADRPVLRLGAEIEAYIAKQL